MKALNLKTTDKRNRRWGAAFLTVGVIGLLLGGWSLIVGPSAPSVLLSAIACLSMGLWIRRAPRISPTSGWVLVIAIGFFAIAIALLDGDEMTADADDGDAGHFSRTYITLSIRRRRTLELHDPITET
jgi:hypothetical protein